MKKKCKSSIKKHSDKKSIKSLYNHATLTDLESLKCSFPSILGEFFWRKKNCFNIPGKPELSANYRCCTA